MLVKCPECGHEFDASHQFAEHSEYFEQIKKELEDEKSKLVINKSVVRGFAQRLSIVVAGAEEVIRVAVDSFRPCESGIEAKHDERSEENRGEETTDSCITGKN